MLLPEISKGVDVAQLRATTEDDWQFIQILLCEAVTATNKAIEQEIASENTIYDICVFTSQANKIAARFDKKIVLTTLTPQQTIDFASVPENEDAFEAKYAILAGY